MRQKESTRWALCRAEAWGESDGAEGMNLWWLLLLLLTQKEKNLGWESLTVKSTEEEKFFVRARCRAVKYDIFFA